LGWRGAGLRPACSNDTGSDPVFNVPTDKYNLYLYFHI
jgi:hypothetical protein